jgi:hypothetical protein
MMILDRLLVGGLRFVLDKIGKVAEAELPPGEGEEEGGQEAALQRQLLAAQIELEMGDLDEAAYLARERQIVKRLEALRAAAATPKRRPGPRRARRA